MTIYDVWVRGVVESEKAREIPGLQPYVYPNLQFFQTTKDIEGFSDKKWKTLLKKLFKEKGVRVPKHRLEEKQEVSVIAKQLDDEVFRGKVKIPPEFTGDNPEFSIEDIYA